MAQPTAKIASNPLKQSEGVWIGRKNLRKRVGNLNELGRIRKGLDFVNEMRPVQHDSKSINRQNCLENSARSLLKWEAYIPEMEIVTFL